MKPFEVTEMPSMGFSRGMHMSRNQRGHGEGSFGFGPRGQRGGRDRRGSHGREEFGFSPRSQRGGHSEGPSEFDPRGQHGGHDHEKFGPGPRGQHGGRGRRGGGRDERPTGFDPRGRRGGRGEDDPRFERREGHRGHRGRDGARVGRGDVRAAILILLSEQPSHGYQIIQQVNERTGGIWQPSPGSVYPALQMLEDEGLVRVEQTEGRRVFHLTDAGQAYVEKHREELTAAWKAVVESVDDKGQELRELLHQVGNALRQVAHEGTVTQIAAARTLLTNTRRQLYRILAEDESSETDQP